MDLVIKALGLDKVTFLFEVGIMRFEDSLDKIAKSGSANGLRIKLAVDASRDGGKKPRKDRRDGTALHLARSGEVAKLLLEAGYKVGDLDEEGNTPLHTAAGAGQEEVVRELLAAGCGHIINNYSKFGKTPLHKSERFPNISKMLQEAGGDPSLKRLGS
jgi:ankyrin repeat protein